MSDYKKQIAQLTEAYKANDFDAARRMVDTHQQKSIRVDRIAAKRLVKKHKGDLVAAQTEAAKKLKRTDPAFVDMIRSAARVYLKRGTAEATREQANRRADELLKKHKGNHDAAMLAAGAEPKVQEELVRRAAREQA